MNLEFFVEVRLHLGNKNKSLSAFYFVLRSVCTIFVANLECNTNLLWLKSLFRTDLYANMKMA